ncbi:hypothetical protein ACLEPN_24655 [Myxococcus sp. 1LA]
MRTPRMSRLVGAALSTALFITGCSESDYVRLYHSEARAPSYSVEDIESLRQIGPTYVDKGVNFALYSENATRLELMLFEDPESNRPARTYEMTRYGDVWSVYVEGVGVGQHYGFRAWAPTGSTTRGGSPGPSTASRRTRTSTATASTRTSC